MTGMNTELLTLLEKDARLTPAQLGTMLGRDEQSVSDEIAEYEKNHIILGYPGSQRVRHDLATEQQATIQ